MKNQPTFNSITKPKLEVKTESPLDIMPDIEGPKADRGGVT